MIATGNSEYNQLGGYAGGGYGYGGGFGGIAPFGLFGLAGLGGLGGFGQNQHAHIPCGGGHHRGDDDCARNMVLLNAISNNKDTIANEGRGVLAAVAASKDVSVAGFTALANAVGETKYDIAKSVADAALGLSAELCTVKDSIKDGIYNLTLQNIANTNDIKGQAQAFQISNDAKFEALSREGERNTAIILAKLNQTELDNLRAELDGHRRRFSDREVEINIQNTNTNVQAQLQAQAQLQTQRDFEHQRRFDLLYGQVAKASQDIINVGGILTGVSQTANPVNVKS